ncbi:hypothetical protein ACFZAM_16200 [Streptomyces sp. NPDC008079]|uniref:hypothetical protein n=1 Tax=Streptomyces sp. NPDC008079 TaxID=3364806 RepID=UPI0036E73127
MAGSRGPVSRLAVAGSAARRGRLIAGVDDWTGCLMLMQPGQVDAASTDDTIRIGLAAQTPTPN